MITAAKCRDDAESAMLGLSDIATPHSIYHVRIQSIGPPWQISWKRTIDDGCCDRWRRMTGLSASRSKPR
jgi:hypothetical protein